MLRLTDQAAAQLQALLASRGQDQLRLRVFLDHRCHCGASHFSMTLDDTARDGESTFEVKGIPFVADAEAAAELDAVEIDYVEDWMRKGFTIRNLNHQCGGHH